MKFLKTILRVVFLPLILFWEAICWLFNSRNSKRIGIVDFDDSDGPPETANIEFEHHKVTFDGFNKLIIPQSNVTQFDIQKDLYSAWKEWAEVNSKWEAAFELVSDNLLSNGKFLAKTFFLTNGWRIVSNSPSSYMGNLLTKEGDSPFVDGEGNPVPTKSAVIEPKPKTKKELEEELVIWASEGQSNRNPIEILADLTPEGEIQVPSNLIKEEQPRCYCNPSYTYEQYKKDNGATKVEIREYSEYNANPNYQNDGTDPIMKKVKNNWFKRTRQRLGVSKSHSTET